MKTEDINRRIQLQGDSESTDTPVLAAFGSIASSAFISSGMFR